MNEEIIEVSDNQSKIHLNGVHRNSGNAVRIVIDCDEKLAISILTVEEATELFIKLASILAKL